MQSAISTKRILAVMMGVMVCISALGVRLGLIAAVRTGWFARKALYQHAQNLALELPRGQITDRNGFPLTGTSSEENLVLFPSFVTGEKRQEVAGRLASLCGLETSHVLRVLDGNEPVVLSRRISAGLRAAIYKDHIPGVVVVAQKLRYPSTNLACHVVGYVRAIDNMGVYGIEKAFDDRLREGPARSLSAIVDARGQAIPGHGLKVMADVKLTESSQVHLTLDEYMQSRLNEAMRAVDRGAAVAIHPQTGEILGMVSKPSFDPIHPYMSFSDKRHPMVNRAVSPYYPGSVFKLVTAAAALEAGVVNSDETFFCPGYAQVTQQRKVKCSKPDGHGELTFIDAISRSCNTTFIEVASRLGTERICDMARNLGLGAKTGVQLQEDKPGTVMVGHKLTPLGQANLALGQEGVMITPLQAAVLMATVVNDGYAVPPRIVLDSGDNTVERKQVMTARTARLLRLALEESVLEGTGKKARVSWGGCAGKTGTAQTGRRDSSGTALTHAWFVGYAPVLNPTIVVAVLVEDGGSGGDVAAPVFRRFIESLILK